jgi:hypothetical protein
MLRSSDLPILNFLMRVPAIFSLLVIILGIFYLLLLERISRHSYLLVSRCAGSDENTF